MITNGKKSHYLAVTNLSALLEKIQNLIVIIIIVTIIIISKNHIQKKKAKHEPSGWPMFTKCSFDKKENTLNYYRGKDCV